MNDSGKKIWEAYKLKCGTSFLTRNGTIVCGVTDPSSFEEIYRKPEFVAEHEGRAAFLFAMLMVHAKHSLDSVLRRSSMHYADAFLRLLFLLCHDVCEISYGDVLDDGSEARDQVREAEGQVMQQLFSCFPDEIQSKMAIWWRDFESYQGEDGTQAMKAVDKAEAVAFQLFLRTKGVYGSVLLKNPPSERDLRLSELASTDRSIDVWCLHYRIVTKRMANEITEPIYDFLSAGFRDVYGPELPRCMTMDVSELDLE